MRSHRITQLLTTLWQQFIIKEKTFPKGGCQMKIDRLVSIIMILLEKKRIGAQELADMFEVSPRTKALFPLKKQKKLN